MDAPERLPCVLLAAGASSRMGARKTLLPLGGEPAVRRAARIALEACDPVIIVVGDDASGVKAALSGLRRVIFAHNPRWREGMVSSAIVGVDAVPDTRSGFFLHHADMPFVRSEVFTLLSREARAAVAAHIALVAARSGKAGHPVYFPASFIPAIRAVGSGERLRGVLDAIGFRLVETGCDGVLEDMDRPEDYVALLAKYGLDDSQA